MEVFLRIGEGFIGFILAFLSAGFIGCCLARIRMLENRLDSLSLTKDVDKEYVELWIKGGLSILLGIFVLLGAVWLLWNCSEYFCDNGIGCK